jgi:sulfatase maturation enzyme AslB (radical SAM superfamily)
MSFDTVDLLTGKVFQVTWDLGRRCNYDCSYCPAHRHDNFSPHASLDELKSAVDFLFEYIDTYMEKRSYKHTSISFTGGEPTVNPNFIPFVKYLKEEYEAKYKDKWACGFALTSNGAMSAKMADAVMENLGHITVSYHAESDNKLKQQVRDRIKQFHDADYSISCNVMFHAAYFDECKDLCDYLHDLGVKYVPRIIGEEPDSKSNFAHMYTDEQLDYMKNYWTYKNAELNETKEEAAVLSAAGEKTSEKKKLGMTIGRPCCGSREMCLSLNGESRKSTFVDLREFKGWHCSVNYFFLHLEQQTDSVYHHQTCQARFDQTRGPIGKISEGAKILADLKEKMNNNTLPTIICPKHTCGCGLCAPKSKYEENYNKVMENHIL